MPRYSPVVRVLTPAVKRPSTSRADTPASASALYAASPWCCNADLFGTIPNSSDSAAPTIATVLERSLIHLLRLQRDLAKLGADAEWGVRDLLDVLRGPARRHFL